ncbi:MAG TPA: hypothetical protein DGT23_10730, partial [Micromonosporaceae bacterium]|nr:hypothetical protein [Micromonosporaceae bacterium]
GGGGPAVIAYGTSGYPSSTSPGPADRGTSFFGGGTSARTRLQQTITLPLVPEIDAGQARFTFGGWLGGYAGQDDGVRLSLEFLDSSGLPRGVAVLGPVTAGERSSTTGLWQRIATGIVPPGSRTARVLLLFTRDGGTSNDGYADSLTLTLSTGGTNLVTNPGAENGLTGWSTLEGAPTVIVYGSNGYPTLTGPGPADRGSRFFSGGTVARSRLAQDVTLPNPSQIDMGGTRYDVKAWLGGWTSQNDRAQLTVVFRSATGQALSTIVLGPVTAADRNNVTGLFQRAATGTVPVGSRTARLELLFTRAGGNANDGYADAVSLVLTSGSL